MTMKMMGVMALRRKMRTMSSGWRKLRKQCRKRMLKLHRSLLIQCPNEATLALSKDPSSSLIENLAPAWSNERSQMTKWFQMYPISPATYKDSNLHLRLLYYPLKISQSFRAATKLCLPWTKIHYQHWTTRTSKETHYLQYSNSNLWSLWLSSKNKHLMILCLRFASNKSLSKIWRDLQNSTCW